MPDFWLSSGHHLLDRDGGGGLLVTDEFLKAYLARPELAPPPDACAAEEEVAFAASLCDRPRDTLIAVRRTFEDGAIREAFRTLHPRGTRKPMRAFSFVEVENEEEPHEDVNLLALARHKQTD